MSIGIPKDSVVKYESALKADKFILVAHGKGAEVAKAKDHSDDALHRACTAWDRTQRTLRALCQITQP